MKLHENKRDLARKKVPEDILKAMNEISNSAIEHGVSNLSLEEINAEIHLARQGK